MPQKTTCPHCTKLFEVPGEFFDTVVSCPSCRGTFNPMKEYVSQAWELTKSPAFQELQKTSIAADNLNITHAQFVTGVESKTMGFTCMFGEPSALLKGARKVFFRVYTSLYIVYIVVPPIVISFWSYYQRNWWLLLGILVSYLATYSAASKSKIIYLFTCICIGVWVGNGFSIHQYITFYFLCALWGYVFFEITEEAQNYFAMRSLIESPELFSDAVAQNKIMIVRK